MSSIEKTDDTPMFPKKLPPPLLKQQPPSAESSDEDSHDEFADNSLRTDRSEMNQLSKSRYGSKGALHSPIGSTHSFDLQVSISVNFAVYSIQVILFRFNLNIFYILVRMSALLLFCVFIFLFSCNQPAKNNTISTTVVSLVILCILTILYNVPLEYVFPSSRQKKPSSKCYS